MQFRVEETENSSDEDSKEEKKRENFDISSIIDGLYKEESSSNQNLKITLKKRASCSFYIEPEHDDQHSRSRNTQAVTVVARSDQTIALPM